MNDYKGRLDPNASHHWTLVLNVAMDNNDLPAQASEWVCNQFALQMEGNGPHSFTFDGTEEQLKTIIQSVSTTTDESFNFIYDAPFPGQPPQGTHCRQAILIPVSAVGRAGLRVQPIRDPSYQATGVELA